MVAAHLFLPLTPATTREFWYSDPHPLPSLVVTPGLDPVATTQPFGGKSEGKRPPKDLSSNRIILQWLVSKYNRWV
jgi:hypothetical protein